MRIYVISLTSASERRASIDAQLRPLGVDYRFFDAVGGHDGFDHFNRYDERQHLINMGRKPIPGEVGCFASHRCLWKQVVSIDEPIVILEDDAVITENFAVALTKTERLIQQYGFIRLQNYLRDRGIKKLQIGRAGPFTLVYYATYPFGAMAYAISPSTAAAFVKASNVLTGPVDQFIKLFWEHGQPLYGLSPYPVVWGDQSARTTIGHRARGEMNLNLSLRKRLKKARRWIQRRRFNAAQHGPEGV